MTVGRSLGFSEHLLHGFLPRMSRENGVKLESKSQGCCVLLLLLVFIPITGIVFIVCLFLVTLGLGCCSGLSSFQAGASHCGGFSCC